MKLLEKINWLLISIYAYFRFKTAKEATDNTNTALIFCNRMGIGNFIEYLPTLRILVLKHDCHIVTNNKQKEIEYLCYLFLGKVCFYKPYHNHYDYVYCNFLNQTKENIQEIIRLNIPNRIGHYYEGRTKWVNIFNLQLPCGNDMNETDFNLMLAIKFYYEHKPFKFNNKKEDYIAIQVNCSNDRSRNYNDISGLIKELQKHGERVVIVGTAAERKPFSELGECSPNFEHTCNIIQSAKLYIGHDSGLTHVAWLCGTPSIVIWMKKESINRSIHENNINLYRPNTENLLTCIKGLL